ncbi:HK97 gp10 family phage protein [Cupriavidus nantongensis]|uniref:HK97 gp10 family phage protein n=1 Tax=Cupriavidus nantongensis TaxID=1796606 RepID=A0A142JHW8_9BURK|nr:HK97 gp10 family phage protein [Cupriavidus nantongensis]AMR77680.1 hypothetical protein A2G96_07995 [Cupriavidus nantongensis]
MPANDDFRRKLAAFVQRAKDNQEKVIREVAEDLLQSIQMRSPVDTGRFLGNWFVQESISQQTTEETDPTGQQMLARGKAGIAEFKPGGVLYIVNFLPYAQRLEYGWSSKSPQGMVRVTIAEFDQYLTKHVGELKQ